MIPVTIERQSDTTSLPMREHGQANYHQAFFGELPENVRELGAAVKYEGGGRLLALLSERSRMANTADDLAHLVGVTPATLAPLLKWLHQQGIVETVSVEGTLFYRLTQDPERRRHVHLFRRRRAEWLAEIQRVANWLDGGRK